MARMVRIMLTMTRGPDGSWNLFDERERAGALPRPHFNRPEPRP